MLTKRYMTSVKNLPKIMEKITEGTAPKKFTISHLKSIGFGHLSDVIVANWDDFSDLVPSQHWIKQRFDELEKARNFVAHNRLLLSGEFQRLEMYINDWNRMVGL